MPRRVVSLSRSSPRHIIIDPAPPSSPTHSFAYSGASTAWSTQGHKRATSTSTPTPTPSPPVSAQTQNSTTGWIQGLRRRSGSSASASVSASLSRTGSSLYTTSTTTDHATRERGSRTTSISGLGSSLNLRPRRVSITLHTPRHEIIPPPSDPIPREHTPEPLLDFDFEPPSPGSGGAGSGVRRRENAKERWTRFRMWWKMGVLRIRRRVERGGGGVGSRV
ncbi:hypothetical protein SAICODRAFT_5007 [Saitoella complicata NRRL Y-17804]|uniref:uncharacterized protein n=1 Tax=Saitoella complicata (strain BCRC 22490 / CBS 7301 / JCM 7358 / NBRC 10748 / NRRL Y-17804) TaxID=698492 RepID=UPI000867D34D|nr:uncharacterized protein SAICODRAFT_5007 [Saitoella complicata NRRL Y-17804]ODQ55784.1 hypothetical protein SAICODRAFT_5007 [Saitoella complicata NRRL Y-17804]